MKSLGRLHLRGLPSLFPVYQVPRREVLASYLPWEVRPFPAVMSVAPTDRLRGPLSPPNRQALTRRGTLAWGGAAVDEAPPQAGQVGHVCPQRRPDPR
jgi:hypothetical protein